MKIIIGDSRLWKCSIKILSISPVLNIPRFWVPPGLWICLWFQVSEYARVTQGSEYAWIILNMHEYAWLCLDMSKYAWICLNLPEWLLFYIFLFLHKFYSLFRNWTRGYLCERLNETGGQSLKETGWSWILIYPSTFNVKVILSLSNYWHSIVQLPVVWNHYWLSVNIS